MPTSPENTYIYKMGAAPNTRAALSQKNKIYGYMVGKGKFQQIGALSTFGFDESRTIEPVRGVGFGDFIAELVPGVTEPMTLTVNKTLMYALNLFQCMGYRGGVDGLVRSLKHHRWPFDIKQELVFSDIATDDARSADGQGAGYKAQDRASFSNTAHLGALFTIYEGCWFQSYNAEFASDSTLIAENSNIQVTDVLDGMSSYGEFIDSGLAPMSSGSEKVAGQAPGAGYSMRFVSNSSAASGIDLATV